MYLLYFSFCCYANQSEFSKCNQECDNLYWMEIRLYAKFHINATTAHSKCTKASND